MSTARCFGYCVVVDLPFDKLKAYLPNDAHTHTHSFGVFFDSGPFSSLPHSVPDNVTAVRDQQKKKQTKNEKFFNYISNAEMQLKKYLSNRLKLP